MPPSYGPGAYRPPTTPPLPDPAIAHFDGPASGPSRWRSVVGTGTATLLLPFALGGLLFLIVRLSPIAVWVISQLPPGRDLLSLYALCLPLVGVAGARLGYRLAEHSWRGVGWLAGACGLFAFLFLWQIYPILTFRAEAFYKRPVVKRPAPKRSTPPKQRPRRRKTIPTPQRTSHYHASDPAAAAAAAYRLA